MNNPEIKTAQYRRLAKYAGSNPFDAQVDALRDAREEFERQGIDMRTVETLGVSVKMSHAHADKYNSDTTRWHVSIKISCREVTE